MDNSRDVQLYVFCSNQNLIEELVGLQTSLATKPRILSIMIMMIRIVFSTIKFIYK
jgi:hypothetical protein